MKPRSIRLALLAAVATAVLVTGAYRMTRPVAAPPSDAQGLDLGAVLGGAAAAGYARATAPRAFHFPVDHGPHPDFRTEWWYFTGNLRTGGGRRFGYELTFFRVALAPSGPERPSAWATRQVYLAHLALTDVDGGRFHYFERYARGALELAGAQADPFRVWLDDWQVRAPAAGGQPWRLRAAAGNVALDLTLESPRPPVLQGEQGLSRKSAAPGNASYYYSVTRFTTQGSVQLGVERFPVTGRSWLDREWSTSALANNESGWDWFALQLDDGHDLMYYRLRKRDGTIDPYSQGVLVDPQGVVTALQRDDVQVEVLNTWTSPTGATYPAGWQLRIPKAHLELTAQPLLADQELAVTVRYWEGAVAVTGARGGLPVSGSGYVELTGYGPRDPALPR